MELTNKKRGAPKKPPEKRKLETVAVRVSVAEKQAFAEAAALEGKKISEWIRSRLRRACRKELDARQPLGALRSIQMEPNIIARDDDDLMTIQ